MERSGNTISDNVTFALMEKRLMVFAGNSLPREYFLDDDRRSQELDDVLQTIEGFHLANIQLRARLEVACVLTYTGSGEVLDLLKEKLEDYGISSEFTQEGGIRGATAG